LLAAAGVRVTGVDLDELGPEVTAARIEITGPAGPRQVTTRLAEGLALAITTQAPVRVADSVLDRLAGPAEASGERDGAPASPPSCPPPGSAPSPGSALPVAAPARRRLRPRYEPRNLGLDGLDGWLFAGSFAEHASQAHWHDYTCVVADGVAVLSAAVPQPEGFAVLGQEVFADDYRGGAVVFGGEFRTGDHTVRAGLFLRVNEGRPIMGPITERAVFTDPDNNIVTIPAGPGWTSHEVTARVPEDTDAVVFGIFLAGPDRIELRRPEVRR
jgi:hypothetical protein